MNAFYPGVEILDNPELKGKSVIVGGSRERGVVSSATYEARKFGVHSSQPTAKAARLCSHGIFVHGRMSRYKEISKQIFEIFCRISSPVNPVSARGEYNRVARMLYQKGDDSIRLFR